MTRFTSIPEEWDSSESSSAWTSFCHFLSQPSLRRTHEQDPHPHHSTRNWDPRNKSVLLHIGPTTLKRSAVTPLWTHLTFSSWKQKVWHFWSLWVEPQTGRWSHWPSRLLSLKKATRLWLWTYFLPSSSKTQHSTRGRGWGLFSSSYDGQGASWSFTKPRIPKKGSQWHRLIDE